MDWVLTFFFKGQNSMLTDRATAQLACFVFLLSSLGLGGCSTAQSVLGSGSSSERSKPIANPFSNYRPSEKGDPSQNMVLRTKKGDRSVELELPGSSQNLSDFVLPVSPAFKNQEKAALDDSASALSETNKMRPLSISDREILQSLPQTFTESDEARTQIEKDLHLVPSEDSSIPENASSYLGAMDHIKALFRMARFEAALLEADELLKLYPTHSKIHEMRGTLFDRLGQRDLALKSWNQALKLDPNNLTLKKFIEHKQFVSGLGGGGKK